MQCLIVFSRLVCGFTFSIIADISLKVTEGKDLKNKVNESVFWASKRKLRLFVSLMTIYPPCKRTIKGNVLSSSDRLLTGYLLTS